MKGDDMISYKWVPNIVTICRAVLGPIVLILALKDKWLVAFCLLLVAWFTDWLDGFLATKLDAKTSFGKRLDPLCDLVFSWSVVIALVITQVIPWLAFLALVLILGPVWLVIIWAPESWFVYCTRSGAQAFYSLLATFAAVVIYAYKALAYQALWLVIPAIPVIILMIWAKRPRLKKWLRMNEEFVK